MWRPQSLGFGIKAGDLSMLGRPLVFHKSQIGCLRRNEIIKEVDFLFTQPLIVSKLSELCGEIRISPTISIRDPQPIEHTDCCRLSELPKT